MLRNLVFIFIALILSGCELIPVPVKEDLIVVPQSECVFIAESESFSPSWHMDASSDQCKVTYWLDVWASASAVPWHERKQLIEKLGDTPDDELHKYVLSQPIDTPYQVRLRAQNTFNSIRPFIQKSSMVLFEKIAYVPSQQLLEYESAITILSQVNARHAKRNEEQAQLLLEQEEKINQLLNLEASILEKNLER